ncbi:choline/ethanolamine kinase family protein [Oharaeibacter diazotrophicus]|uniref:Thiamine kinase-like enzyme n=1 Tax=Oharaeibacter diazotrophicus TaxID=1920512 RepID=A0A4R6RBK1_9HYPH|nr:choline/ethanolamine kinase family protein [Oharaeibacter diazotrophicus]TDP83510.1 thiamine kinase-like enzyme [Oharaeibacter diazotrophicus]BBE72343.1 choline/ethanolamine kinase [Pleomorphomonas sp. SM30]GLS79113.1 choline kinase [Oharaeibacter diazotrophicus]
MAEYRSAGEAATVHEKALEAAAARVPAWAGRGFRYRPLVGGIMNQNWLVEVEGEARSFFLKIPGPGSEMFIDRLAANEAARNAHAIGVAPEVVFFDPADGLEVHEFLVGYRACTNADFADPAIQAGVLDIYRRLHAGPMLSLTKTVFDMIEEHVEQGRELGAHFPPAMDWILHRYGEAKAAFLASGLDVVPCFNDPMPGNFLIDAVGAGKPMKLIDYEFASNNERAYELGVLFAEMFYDEAKTLELIETYCGEVRPATVARIVVSRALADVKWASWAVVNRKLNTWDFDYQKYGIWKYMRARDVMADPRWDTWLRAM